MKDLKCPVHGTALVEKEVPVFYGMPTADSDIFEIGSRFPHLDLWSLGGCEVSGDSPENRIGLVCSDCHYGLRWCEGQGLERRSLVGGAVETEERLPGHRISNRSYTES